MLRHPHAFCQHFMGLQKRTAKKSQKPWLSLLFFPFPSRGAVSFLGRWIVQSTLFWTSLIITSWLTSNTYIWVNYHISLTWILRPFGDDFPNPNHDFQGSGEQWGRYNLPRYMIFMVRTRYCGDLRGLRGSFLGRAVKKYPGWHGEVENQWKSPCQIRRWNIWLIIPNIKRVILSHNIYCIYIYTYI